MRKALFAGTFNPPTLGHLSLILRASKLCDELIVAVIVNPHHKNSLTFSLNERKEMVEWMTRDCSKVTVVAFDGLVVDCAIEHSASFLIRGIRSALDFENESQMAFANRTMQGIETVLLIAEEPYTKISSSLVREIAAFGGEISPFLPPVLVERVKRKFR